MSVPAKFKAKVDKITSEETTKRRVPGMLKRVKDRDHIRADMNLLSKELQELQVEIETHCTHAWAAVEHEAMYFDDTLGNHGHTSHWLHCTDCGKRWTLGET